MSPISISSKDYNNQKKGKVNEMIRLIFIALIMTALAGCGSDYEAGEKVWINLKGKSVFTDGFARAMVIEDSGDLVNVQVSQVSTPVPHKLTATLEVGKTTFVSKDIVDKYATGEKAFGEKRKSAKEMLGLIEKGIGDSKPILERARTVADTYQNKEISGMVEFYGFYESAFDTEDQLKRIDAFPDFISNIKDLLDKHTGTYEPGSYQFVIDSYKNSEGQRVYGRARQLGMPTPFSKPKTLGLTDADAVEVLSSIIPQQMYDKLNKYPLNNAKSIQEVVSLFPKMVAMNESYLAYVTDNGAQTPGTETLEEKVKDRKLSITSRAVERLRSIVLTPERVAKLNTRKEADESYEKAVKELANASELLGTEILTEKDKNDFFLAKVIEKEQEQKNKKIIEMVLTSNEFYEGMSVSTRGKKYPLKIKIGHVEGGGNKITGEIHWMKKGSVDAIHQIDGILVGSELRFKETKRIKRGSAGLNCISNIKPNTEDELSGAYRCSGERGKTVIYIEKKSSDVK